MQATKIVPASTMTNIIQTASSATDVQVRDLWIYGTGDTNTVERGFFSNSGTDIAIKNCRFENMTYGIHFLTTVRGSVTECLITGIIGASGVSEGYGMLASDNCDHISVIDNKFKTIARHAIYYSSGTSNSEIIGNEIDGTTESAIPVYATNAQNPCKNIIIANNIIENVTSVSGSIGYGIEISDHVDNSKIVGNTIDNCENYGIFLQSDSSATDSTKIINRSLVANNIIENCNQGIRLANALDIQLLGNKIFNTASHGIHVTQSGAAAATITKRVKIDGNVVRTAAGNGIVISGGTYLDDVTLGVNEVSDITGSDFTLSGGMTNFKNVSGPVWHEDLITYSDFNTASGTPTHDFAYVLPNGSVITGLWWRLITEFAGGSVSAATLKLGITGLDDDGFFPAENVFTGAGTGYKDSGVDSWGAFLYSSGNNQSLQYFCTAARTLTFILTLTDDTGDNLTAGEFRFWLRYESVNLL
jgi:hypothetical protein